MANEPTLLPVKPGTLNVRDKAALRKAGVIVIEHENPAELRLLKPGVELDSTDMLIAAMRGVNRSSSAQIVFAEQLSKLMEVAFAKRGGG